MVFSNVYALFYFLVADLSYLQKFRLSLVVSSMICCELILFKFLPTFQGFALRCCIKESNDRNHTLFHNPTFLTRHGRVEVFGFCFFFLFFFFFFFGKN
jgi:uncharacterized membrane protein